MVVSFNSIFCVIVTYLSRFEYSAELFSLEASRKKLFYWFHFTHTLRIFQFSTLLKKYLWYTSALGALLEGKPSRMHYLGFVFKPDYIPIDMHAMCLTQFLNAQIWMIEVGTYCCIAIDTQSSERLICYRHSTIYVYPQFKEGNKMSLLWRKGTVKIFDKISAEWVNSSCVDRFYSLLLGGYQN